MIDLRESGYALSQYFGVVQQRLESIEKQLQGAPISKAELDLLTLHVAEVQRRTTRALQRVNLVEAELARVLSTFEGAMGEIAGRVEGLRGALRGEPTGE